jgi:hypothetical protein
LPKSINSEERMRDERKRELREDKKTGKKRRE